MPFLPLYIRDLGVSDVADIAFWTGLTLGATPAVTAFSAPLWGRVGDRYGSKVLVLRSLSAFVLTKGAMAFVTAPWQLFALRALSACSRATARLPSRWPPNPRRGNRWRGRSAPSRSRSGLGPAVGPVIGGILAQAVGLRASFIVAAVFYLLAMLLIAVFYVEPRTATPVPHGVRCARFSGVVSHTGFVMVFTAILGLQLVDRSFGPILPLYVELLGLPESEVAFVSGVLFSIAAVFAAFGHHVAEPLMLYWPSRVLVAGSATATALGLLLLVLVPSIWAFAVALAISGVAIGVGMTSAYTSGGRLLPHDAHATGFGVLTTASLVGLAVSPIVAGFISGPGLRVVFEADIVLLVGLALAAWALMEARVTHPATVAPRYFDRPLRRPRAARAIRAL